MSPWVDVFREVLQRMPEDSQAVLMVLGNSQERLIAGVNRFLAENTDFPVVAAVWGARKGIRTAWCFC